MFSNGFPKEWSTIRKLMWLYYAAGGGASTLTVTGISPLSLVNAIARRLVSLTQTGKCEQRSLPVEYTELEYIGSTGEQYIDLGRKATEKSVIKVKHRYPATSDTAMAGRIFGSRYTAGDRKSVCVGTNNGKITETDTMFGMFTATTGSVTGPTVSVGNTWHEIEISANGLTVDGTVYGTPYVGDPFETPFDVVLFGFRQSANAQTDPTVGCGIEDIAALQWVEDGVLVIDLVAAKRNSDNKPGMYNKVSGNLLTNANADAQVDFTLGNAATPTPSDPVDIWCNNGKLKARHQSGLPLGYQLLSSLTADGRCLVNTGIVLQEGDEIDLDYALANPQPGSLPSDRFLFGTANVDTSKGGTWVEVYTTSGSMSNPAWYVRFSSTVSLNSNLPPTTLSGHLALKRGQFIVNGETYLTPEYSGAFQTTPLTLFGRYDASLDNYKGAQMTASHFTVKNGSTYRFNGVMVKRLSDNALGVYDLVSGTFCENLGDGTFTAGAVASDPVEIYADGTPETLTVTDADSNTQTVNDVSNLLAVGGYADTEEIIGGAVTHNIGVLVLNGTEDWQQGTYTFLLDNAIPNALYTSTAMCTHFTAVQNDTAPNNIPDNGMKVGASGYRQRIYIKCTSCADSTAFKALLAGQYAAGTPVIVLYPLAEETTTQTTAHALTTAKGTNTVTAVTNVDPVMLKCEYKGKTS